MAAAPHFLFSLLLRSFPESDTVITRFLQLLAVLLLVISPFAQAQLNNQDSSRYLADIELHTVAELSRALQSVENHLQKRPVSSGRVAPVVFVLHGPEAKALLLSNYNQNQVLMDMAARLSAFELVDIRVCRTWMGGNGVDERDLPPFVTTVPYGPAEIERLLEQENYVYF